jgi:DNA-binding response OmpR family regulator
MGLLEQFADKRVLVVDSERNIITLLAINLEMEGLRNIGTASDGVSALALHTDEPFDLILLDNNMRRLRGPAALRELRCRGDWVPVIMHSAWDPAELDLDGLELFAFMQKPFSIADYMRTVRDALQAPRVRKAPLPSVSRTKAASRPRSHKPVPERR